MDTMKYGSLKKKQTKK